MRYVDGYVLPIKKKNVKAYTKMAKYAAKVWKQCGALDYVEAVADDMTSVKQWNGLSFPAMVKTKKDETIIFAYIVFKSKKHRDTVNKKVMKQMEQNKNKYKDMPMPFDMRTMAYGGFTMIVNE